MSDYDDSTIASDESSFDEGRIIAASEESSFEEGRIITANEPASLPAFAHVLTAPEESRGSDEGRIVSTVATAPAAALVVTEPKEVCESDEGMIVNTSNEPASAPAVTYVVTATEPRESEDGAIVTTVDEPTGTPTAAHVATSPEAPRESASLSHEEEKKFEFELFLSDDSYTSEMSDDELNSSVASENEMFIASHNPIIRDEPVRGSVHETKQSIAESKCSPMTKGARNC